MYGYFRVRVPLLGFLFLILGTACTAIAGHGQHSAETLPDVSWESQARLHRRFRSVPGTLVVDAEGIHFRLSDRYSHHWPFVEVQTVELAPHRLLLTSYENRSWHRLGERQFRFDLDTSMPPETAAGIVRLVGKPGRNENPDPHAASFAAIPARHDRGFRGSSGILHFREEGIDYATESGADARSWRWADIQTLANPDPQHFRVAGYVETFDFKLKQPMTRELFDRLWDKVYARDLNLSARRTEAHQ